MCDGDDAFFVVIVLVRFRDVAEIFPDCIAIETVVVIGVRCPNLTCWKFSAQRAMLAACHLRVRKFKINLSRGKEQSSLVKFNGLFWQHPSSKFERESCEVLEGKSCGVFTCGAQVF